jgi:hypothetical protein
MRVFLLGASPGLTASGVFPGGAAVVPGGAAADVGDAAAKLAKTGGNTGNQIIAYGLLQTLQYDSVSWDYSIGPARVDSEFDVIVIAAANFLHTGFDFAGMAAFIEATRLPVVMVGVGAQSNNYSPDIDLKPGTRRLMHVVAERSKLIGARGPFTSEVLSRMGIHNVQVTGCPSHYMGATPELCVRKPPLGANPRMMVNSSRDVVSHAFNRDRMIDVVCGLLAVAVERHCDFAPQSELPEIRIADASDEPAFEAALQDLLTSFPFYRRVAPVEQLSAWFRQHVRVYWDVANWFDDIKTYDFVFGNRFHGNMIAIQAGVPACVICHDTRTTEMCEFLGIPSVGLMDLEGLDGGKVDPARLYDRVDPDAIQARYDVLYPAFKEFLATNQLPTRLR